MEPRELALEIARIIDEKKGHDIVVLDLTGLSDITEYFVIATGDSNRMVDAIVDEIENQLRVKDVKAFSIEGRVDNTWDLMDFGPVSVHVFQPDARDFYRLERLWGAAPRIEYADGVASDAGPLASDRRQHEDLEALDAATVAAEELIKERLQRGETR